MYERPNPPRRPVGARLLVVFMALLMQSILAMATWLIFNWLFGLNVSWEACFIAAIIGDRLYFLFEDA